MVCELDWPDLSPDDETHSQLPCHTRHKKVKLKRLTYLIGPLRNELSMFFELIPPDAFPSTYFERLIDEFNPFAVD